MLKLECYIVLLSCLPPGSKFEGLVLRLSNLCGQYICKWQHYTFSQNLGTTLPTFSCLSWLIDFFWFLFYFPLDDFLGGSDVPLSFGLSAVLFIWCICFYRIICFLNTSWKTIFLLLDRTWQIIALPICLASCFSPSVHIRIKWWGVQVGYKAL
jgi:hypothetical protein